MKVWLNVIRRRWFPSKIEKYQNGVEFAKAHFNGCFREQEADMLYEGLPLERRDDFDRAVIDYYEKLLIELRKPCP